MCLSQLESVRFSWKRLMKYELARLCCPLQSRTQFRQKKCYGKVKTYRRAWHIQRVEKISYKGSKLTIYNCGTLMPVYRVKRS